MLLHWMPSVASPAVWFVEKAIAVGALIIGVIRFQKLYVPEPHTSVPSPTNLITSCVIRSQLKTQPPEEFTTKLDVEPSAPPKPGSTLNVHPTIPIVPAPVPPMNRRPALRVIPVEVPHDSMSAPPIGFVPAS